MEASRLSVFTKQISVSGAGRGGAGLGRDGDAVEKS